MGTTRTSLLAGSTSYVAVIAIEGYEKLLTTGTAAAALTAWSGCGWSSAIGGAFVDLQIDQALSPDEPLPKMGTCTLWVIPSPGDDSFGVALGRKTSAAETYLAATLTNSSTTATVKDTTAFAASGTIHIGTEACTYSGKTATTFTGLTRGTYSPFGTLTDVVTFAATKSFSHYHRVGLDASSVNLQPVVSSTQRTWNGRLVGIWLHKVTAGVLDVKSEAELVFAGKIVDTRDDPNTAAAVVQLAPITEVLSDAVIGRSQWVGEAIDGNDLYLSAGQFFTIIDNNGLTVKASTPNLTVVASGAAGAYQINEGFFSLTDLTSLMNTWLAAAKTAGTINGTYSIASPVTIPGGQLRTKIYWTLNPAGLSQMCTWQIGMPSAVSDWFGFDTTTGVLAGKAVQHGPDHGGSQQTFYQNSEPQRTVLVADGGASARLSVNDRTGTIVDQYATLPGVMRQATTGSGTWGLFKIGKYMYLGQHAAGAVTGTTELSLLRPAFPVNWETISNGTLTDDMIYIKVPLAGPQLSVLQIYAFEDDPISLFTALAISCGTTFYNSSTITLPFGCGAEIPYELIVNMVESMAGFQAFTGSIAMIVEKPTKLSELIRSDLVFRWAFLYWRDGNIEAGTWKAPTIVQAVATLDESNKAEPAGNSVNHRTATTETAEWLRPIVKIRYNRNAVDASGDDYRSALQFEDRVSVDDSGGVSSVSTINLRNTYVEMVGSGQSVESLLPAHLALMPLVSRPARKLTRSISAKMFLAISLGDVVLIADTFARDPETGTRGITERPALVMRVKYNWGGLQAGSDKPGDIGGEVDLFFTDQNPDRQGPQYVPSADINDLYSVGGYDHGYLGAGPSIYCVTNRFTESTEGVDAASFSDGDKILIVERDPLDPDNPTKWERTIATGGVSGNAITLTAALSSPAWDANKKYHVLYQDYAAATSAQHAKAFQADDATGLVVATAQPFLYGSGQPDSTYTANVLPTSITGSDIELPPNSRYADGAGRDVAHEAAMIRLANNLIDYKGAYQFPMLMNSVVSNTTATSTSYLMVAYWPIFLSLEIPSNAVYRLLTVAPWAYSTDGTSTKVRVTLSRERPSFASATDPPWQGTFGQYEWTGITSTTPVTLATGTIATNVKNPTTGRAWVVLELGYKCATRGLARVVEGPRTTS